MATLLLTTVGTIVGGPIGGAVGALLGREIDGRLLAPRQSGPRLKELKVSGSSYGDPIARHFGLVRAPGTIVWSTDLKEHAEKSGGGKGKPKSTSYSYSISFAVLLASRRIDEVRRIWADGNLLRGAAGDLKTQGTLRIYRGRADQRPDPLMAAALGETCPAFRGCAYAVFEDLALSDFGNRIPALSFEIAAGDGAETIGQLALEAGATADAPCAGLRGYTYEGGSLATAIAELGALYPLAQDLSAGQLAIRAASADAAGAIMLDPPSAWDEGDFGVREGQTRHRAGAAAAPAPEQLRYYDAARDYQPGLQRVLGEPQSLAGQGLELPAVFAPATARRLIDRAHRRAAQQRDTLMWRTACADPRVRPGALVRAPGIAGLWTVRSWELRQGGVELSLARFLNAPASMAEQADGGEHWRPRDRVGQPTRLRVFELPWSGTGSGTDREIFAAASAGSGLWSGGVLYARNGAALEAVADLPARRAVMGTLAAPLAGSYAMRVDPDAILDVQLFDSDAELSPATPEALANGANRACVGHEVLQFMHATPLGAGRWQLTGLLRGRGATEAHARRGHPVAAAFTLLDDNILALPAGAAPGPSREFAAIGIADEQPVIAALQGAGTTRRPLVPVHPDRRTLGDGTVRVAWARRARGSWEWPDDADTPLVEETERYQIGIGPFGSPAESWTSPVPYRDFAADQWASLAARYPDRVLWVRQCGRFAKSDPLALFNFEPALEPIP